jgi:hypothetical protein
LDEFYRVALRKKIYRSIHELQVDLEAWWSITMIGDRFKATGDLADPDADFLDALPFGPGEIHRRLTTDPSHTAANRQHRLSDQVWS